MKLLRNTVIVLAAAVMVACLSDSSFAAEKTHNKDWQGVCQAKIKALKDSAAILQKSNPDLAKGLTDLADQKEKEMQGAMDMKAKHDTKTKMLRDSAAALQKTNPDLAKELWDMSEQKHMGKAGWGKKKCPMGMMEHKKSGE